MTVGRTTARRVSVRAFAVLALALSVALATGLSPFASSSPDGLERVGQDQGFAAQGGLHPVQQEAPVPDYAVPGIADSRLATAAAGFLGTIAVFALAYGAALALRRRGSASARPGGAGTPATGPG